MHKFRAYGNVIFIVVCSLSLTWLFTGCGEGEVSTAPPGQQVLMAPGNPLGEANEVKDCYFIREHNEILNSDKPALKAEIIQVRVPSDVKVPTPAMFTSISLDDLIKKGYLEGSMLPESQNGSLWIGKTSFNRTLGVWGGRKFILNGSASACFPWRTLYLRARTRISGNGFDNTWYLPTPPSSWYKVNNGIAVACGLLCWYPRSITYRNQQWGNHGFGTTNPYYTTYSGRYY